MRTRGPPRLIGGIGFGRMPTGEVEFGYWIARPYWGLGFATEAGRAAIANARHRCASTGSSPAISSTIRHRGGCCEKLGFRPSGGHRTALQRRPRRRGAVPAVRAGSRAVEDGTGGTRDGGLTLSSLANAEAPFRAQTFSRVPAP